MKISAFCLLSVLLVSSPFLLAQNRKAVSTPTPSLTITGRLLWIQLHSKHILSGELVQMDSETVDFKVKGILQSVSLDDVKSIHFDDPRNDQSQFIAPTPVSLPHAMTIHAPMYGLMSEDNLKPITVSLRPTILHKEPAEYTIQAKANKTQGTVVLSLVYYADGHVGDFRVIRGLPDGLTVKAIEAARKIQFIPAIKDGKPVNVRGQVEFNFNSH